MGTGPNNGGVITFSQTAAQNATADDTQGWAEGMAPSSINNSARAGLASIAKYRDDIAGSIVTSGTANTFSLSSNQQFANLSYLAGQMIAFSPHLTNTQGSPDVTLTIDSIPNIPLRTAPNVPLLAGTLIAGTPYLATYSAADNALYLHGFYGSPYLIPIGGLLDSIISTPPNAQFAIPNGQLISRTTYATLFGLIGTTYGVGDGSTYALPNFQGRVTAMMEATPTLLTTAGFGGNSSVIGAVNTKGGETELLVPHDIPAGVPSSGNNTITVNAGGGSDQIPFNSGGWNSTAATLSGASAQVPTGATSIQALSSMSGSNTITVASTNTGQTAHPNVQPTAIVQKFLRVI